jgi:hypothetical protein
MKMNKILKTDGKWSWRKIGTALMVPVIMFCLSTAYSRYSWMRDQCYKVATNEKSIIQAGEHLKQKDAELSNKDEKLEQMIKDLKAELKKSDGILHGRMSKETDKRENKDDQLMGLIIEMLKQQQKSMEIQQKQLSK